MLYCERALLLLSSSRELEARDLYQGGVPNGIAFWYLALPHALVRTYLCVLVHSFPSVTCTSGFEDWTAGLVHWLALAQVAQQKQDCTVLNCTPCSLPLRSHMVAKLGH